ncbi:hypothetical protein AB0D33_41280 [Streptomyces sp. NPDC048404]|uniref:hypothetical protein n=1 Tax=unclassified Streptomyces TaxID=2593676 RepID=UPI00343825D2
MSGQLLAGIRMSAHDDGLYAPVNEALSGTGRYSSAYRGPRPHPGTHREPGPRTPLGPM